MSKTAKKDYGLPEIGGTNVAAALVGKGQKRADEATEIQEEEAATSKKPTKPTEAVVASPPGPPLQKAVAESEVDSSTAPPPGPPPAPENVVPVPQPVGEPPRRVGRPKGPPSRRMHLAIENSLADYLDRAWRTHERPDGRYASGPADLVEDLLSEHQRRLEAVPSKNGSAQQHE